MPRLTKCVYCGDSLNMEVLRYTSETLKALSGPHKINRRTRKTLFCLWLWKPLTAGIVCESQSADQRNVRHRNLVPLKKEPNVRKQCRNLILCYLSPRCVKNKALSVNVFIASNEFGLVRLTETWLGSATDKSSIAELVPFGYNIKHVPRQNGKQGGGVAVIYRQGIAKSHLRSFLLCKKKAVCIINHASYNSQTDILFANLGILKIDDIYRYFLGRYMFSQIYSLLPERLMRNFVLSQNIHEYNRTSLYKSHCRTSLVKNSFTHRGPHYWNSLPISVKEVPRVNVEFLKKLKMYLLSFYTAN